MGLRGGGQAPKRVPELVFHRARVFGLRALTGGAGDGLDLALGVPWAWVCCPWFARVLRVTGVGGVGRDSRDAEIGVWSDCDCRWVGGIGFSYLDSICLVNNLCLNPQRS